MKDLERNIDHAPALATILACGIGSLALGIAIVAGEANSSIKALLNFYNPVGPLAGKTMVACVAYFISWAALSIIWKGKNLNYSKWITVTFILLITAFILSFPPFFEMFTKH